MQGRTLINLNRIRADATDGLTAAQPNALRALQVAELVQLRAGCDVLLLLWGGAYARRPARNQRAMGHTLVCSCHEHHTLPRGLRHLEQPPSRLWCRQSAATKTMEWTHQELESRRNRLHESREASIENGLPKGDENSRINLTIEATTTLTTHEPQPTCYLYPPKG